MMYLSDKLCESRIDGARTAFHEAGIRLSSVKQRARPWGCLARWTLLKLKRNLEKISVMLDSTLVGAPAPAPTSIKDFGSEGKQYAYNNNLVLNLPFQLQNGEYQGDTQQMEQEAPMTIDYGSISLFLHCWTHSFIFLL
ncbi:hypothetical protein K7X08_024769 [Anisodus acutangulus]|uniref:Uncharacterized protein n=1 Tax=Anisodus acutangulus TaxID=402998 RepID=A0A9Q1RD90_9SOLA|nr:hypothetical protein K7X08_024769 [Anisodus acutangulus]